MIGLHYTEIAASGSKKKRIAPFGTGVPPNADGTTQQQRSDRNAMCDSTITLRDKRDGALFLETDDYGYEKDIEKS